MTGSTPPASARAALRARIASGDLLLFPGAFNALTARLIADKGFDGVYLSGAVMAADLGLPDIGLTTMTEVTTRARQLVDATTLPVLVDADTGFGEMINLARTVEHLEHAGVTGFHVEDQVNPKRCGHLDGKEVVDLDTAVRRVAACVSSRRDPQTLIVARTDVRAVDGPKAMLERARALADAGADMIFPEAVASIAEYEAVREAAGVPVLANVTEFGKNELYATADLASAGVSIAIYPVSLLRLAMGVAETALDTLRAEGSLAGLVPQMQTRARLYELLDYASYNKFDSAIFNYEGGR